MAPRLSAPGPGAETPTPSGSTPDPVRPAPVHADRARPAPAHPAPGPELDFPPDTEVRDTPAEVDAAFRAQRGVALAYFLVFLVLVAAFPVLTMTLPWWTEARVFGELSPGFVAAAGGLYLAFAVIGIAASRLSASVESRMLGGQQTLEEGSPGPTQGAEGPR